MSFKFFPVQVQALAARQHRRQHRRHDDDAELWRLNEVVRKSCDDGDDDADDVRPLSAMFKIGQLVVCSVVDIEKKETVCQPG